MPWYGKRKYNNSYGARKTYTKGYLGRKGFPKGRNYSKKRWGSMRKRTYPTSKVMPYLMPDRIYVKMGYIEELTGQYTAGVPYRYTFRGNSLYDPDSTGAGHQPMSFDQWSALYSNYTVHGSKIEMEVLPLSSALIAGVLEWLVYPGTTAPVIGDGEFSRYKEQKYTKAGFTNHYKGKYTTRNYISTAKMFGRSPVAIKSDVSFSAAINANPTNVWYWNTAVRVCDGATTGDFRIIFKVVYYAEMWNSPPLPES